MFWLFSYWRLLVHFSRFLSDRAYRRTHYSLSVFCLCSLSVFWWNVGCRVAVKCSWNTVIVATVSSSRCLFTGFPQTGRRIVCVTSNIHMDFCLYCMCMRVRYVRKLCCLGYTWQGFYGRSWQRVSGRFTATKTEKCGFASRCSQKSEYAEDPASKTSREHRQEEVENNDIVKGVFDKQRTQSGLQICGTKRRLSTGLQTNATILKCTSWLNVGRWLALQT